MQYKFAPALIMLDANETVDAWTATGVNLDPRQLIPALMRYSSEPRPMYAPYLSFELCNQMFLLFGFKEVYFIKIIVLLEQ